MTIEEAIKTALVFEKKVHALYETAAKNATDVTARKVFATLAQEERGHVTYLESRLARMAEGRPPVAREATHGIAFCPAYPGWGRAFARRSRQANGRPRRRIVVAVPSLGG